MQEIKKPNETDEGTQQDDEAKKAEQAGLAAGRLASLSDTGDSSSNGSEGETLQDLSKERTNEEQSRYLQELSGRPDSSRVMELLNDSELNRRLEADLEQSQEQAAARRLQGLQEE